MTVTPDATPDAVARALRSPFVPSVVRDLAAASGYLDAVWPQVAPSVETAGFLGSALYMADMALDGVEEVYDPLLSRESLLRGGIDEHDLARLVAVLDVFQYLQPQLLLLLAALAEGWQRPSVGGQGRAAPREASERETAHLATVVDFASAAAGPLPRIAEVLGVQRPPDLYRAVAVWPGYLSVAWDELQHLPAYPGFRRRGRALYYYARSSSRFLAVPLRASRDALRERGLDDASLDAAQATVEGALPVLATMMMHCSAMRAALGLTTREVVAQS